MSTRTVHRPIIRTGQEAADGGPPRMHGHQTVKAPGVILGTILVLAILYPMFIRPWQHHWGATPAEVARAMPGDDLVPKPLEVTTRAVTVNALPEYIWPWLVQQGYQRGGLYSYDWIDQLIGALDRPSADRVLPEFQNVQAGDVVPYAKGTNMVVRALEPNRSLLLQAHEGDVNITHSWGLYPVDDQHTRLVLRVRATMRVTPRLLPMLMVLDVAEPFMVHRQLHGVKQRAEALAGATAGT